MASQDRVLFLLLALIGGILFGEGAAYDGIHAALIVPLLIAFFLPLCVFRLTPVSPRFGSALFIVFIAMGVYTGKAALVPKEALTVPQGEHLYGTVGEVTAYDTGWRIILNLQGDFRASAILWSATPLDPSPRVGESGWMSARFQVPIEFRNRGVSDTIRRLWRQGHVAEGRAIAWNPLHPRDEVDSFVEKHRGRLRAELARLSPGEGKEFVEAMIFGEMSRLSPQTRNQWKQMGIYHLVVVSGLHLAVFYGSGYFLAYALTFLIPVFWKRWTRQDIAILAGMTASFLPLSLYPETPSLSRSLAALLAWSLLKLLRVPMSGFLLLSGVCGGYLLAWPMALFDLSFQLTFLCAFSILLLGPPLEDGIRRLLGLSPDAGRVSEGLIKTCVATMATTLGLAPLIAHLQGRLYLAGILINLIAIPLFVFLLTPLAIIGAIGAFFSAESLPVTVRIMDGVFFALRIVFQCSNFSIIDPFSAPLSSMIFWLVLLLCGYLYAMPKRRAPAIALVLSLGIAGITMVEAAGRFHTPKIAMTLFDVGQGESMLLQSDGEALLADGGGTGKTMGGRVLVPAIRAQGVRALKAILLSHPDQDHYGALESVLEVFPVREFWWNGERSRNDAFEELLLALHRRGTRLERVYRGVPPRDLGKGRLAFFHPHTRHVPFSIAGNPQSVVARFSYDEFSLLLTGDIERLAESTLLQGRDELRSDVLKVPHHGSRTSSTAIFLNRVHPALAIASMGRENRFGHPHADILERYRESGIPFVRTDESGALSLTSDGRNFKLTGYGTDRVFSGSYLFFH